jgi:hypothetical protein
MLTPSRVLTEHALRDEDQDEQPGGQRRLHHDQRGEREREHLKRPSKDRHSRAKEPARAPHQAPGKRHPQVLMVGCVLGLRCLKGNS